MNHKKHHGSFSHIIMMILACVIPLVIIAFLPTFGISSKWSTVGGVILMIILHVWMMKDYILVNHKQKKEVQIGLLPK